MNLSLFSIFAGKYIFKRYVSSSKIQMTGYANFTELSVAWKHYHEEGTYIWKGREHYFYQNRLFQIHEEELMIFKYDKTILHRFHLKKDCKLPIYLQHTHHCKHDLYTVDLLIHSHNKFSTNYLIFGPNKPEHTITTDFWRVS
jgi:hypothetical protein